MYFVCKITSVTVISVIRALFNAIVVMAVVFLMVDLRFHGSVTPKKSRVTTAQSELSNIRSALQFYKLQNGDYPSASQGLLALLEKPVGKPEAKNWQEGGYLDRIPKDPWGGDYLYRNPGFVDPIEVYTLGGDGRPGGLGECADYYSSDFGSTGNGGVCKPRRLPESTISRIYTVLSVIVLGIMLSYLIRHIFKSVDRNIYKFITEFFFWFVGLAYLVWLFTPRIF